MSQLQLVTVIVDEIVVFKDIAGNRWDLLGPLS